MSIIHLPNIEYIKPVYGFKNIYATTFGRIYKLSKNGTLIQISKTKHNQGYYKATLKKRHIKTHQLIKYTFYNFPFQKSKLVIHHKNNIKNNNHIKNLQITTSRRNTSLSKKTNLPTGVQRIRKSSKYKAAIVFNKKTIYLGSFNNLQDASFIYNEAESIIDKDLHDEIKTYYLDFTNTIPITKFNPNIDYHNKIPNFKDENGLLNINLKHYVQIPEETSQILQKERIDNQTIRYIIWKNSNSLQITNTVQWKIPNRILQILRTSPKPFEASTYLRW
jgi:hypothetical protein